MIPFSSKSVEEVFVNYPMNIQERMLALRDLIHTTSEKMEIGSHLTETLKWGEPSYLCKNGTTIRIHWKDSDPEFYRMYFHCQTSLISTFRNVYPDDFCYEGNRAIRFDLLEDPDLIKLERCVESSLMYHILKSTPNLGLSNQAEQGSAHQSTTRSESKSK